MKTTRYFERILFRSDRAQIERKWIQHAIDNPEHTVIQKDGRIRVWTRVPEMGNRYLRVILLEDGKTVHNAFFDRRFKQ